METTKMKEEQMEAFPDEIPEPEPPTLDETAIKAFKALITEQHKLLQSINKFHEALYELNPLSAFWDLRGKVADLMGELTMREKDVRVRIAMFGEEWAPSVGGKREGDLGDWIDDIRERAYDEFYGEDDD